MLATQTEKVQLRLVGLNNITVDPEIQSRVKCDREFERQFAEAMLRGDLFPPVDVFWDGEAYLLADGFHRYSAHQRVGQDNIRCRIHEGSRRDAIVFSAGANRAFSIPRTLDDMRKAAGMLFADDEWFNKSAEQIAKHIGVRGSTITSWRSLWCQDKGVKPPRKVITAKGTKQVVYRERAGRIWKDSKGNYKAKLDRKIVLIDADNRQDAEREFRFLEEKARIEKRNAMFVPEVKDALNADPESEAMQETFTRTVRRRSEARIWDLERLRDFLHEKGVAYGRVEKRDDDRWEHLVIPTGRCERRNYPVVITSQVIVLCLNFGGQDYHKRGITIAHVLGQFEVIKRHHEQGPIRRPGDSPRLASAEEFVVVSEGHHPKDFLELAESYRLVQDRFRFLSADGFVEWFKGGCRADDDETQDDGKDDDAEIT
jgi:ParB-like chromosome segregation protein Spo0J